MSSTLAFAHSSATSNSFAPVSGLSFKVFVTSESGIVKAASPLDLRLILLGSVITTELLPKYNGKLSPFCKDPDTILNVSEFESPAINSYFTLLVGVKIYAPFLFTSV